MPDSFDYSPHALRLDGREWLIILALLLVFSLLAPKLWTRAEPFDPAADYRVPYALSDDYWMFQRRLEEAATDSDTIFVVGDSVIWGEYVAADGTLSHFLNEEAGGDHLFANAGLNGLFPLALEGLFRDFGRPVKNHRVLLHANLLWMTSPEADLSATKEQKFNHEPLVPQFSVRIPCYRAPLDRRLGHLADRKVPLLSWSNHLHLAYFDQLGIPDWTLEPGHAYTNPLVQLTAEPPGELTPDPDRGESSPRHRPWSTGDRQPQSFNWVPPGDSLQWAAFQRLVRLLRDRRNDVLVIIGPLNKHMMTGPSRQICEEMERELRRWLDNEGVPSVSPALLTSDLYGDASHPLTAGYRILAQEISTSPAYKEWISR